MDSKTQAVLDKNAATRRERDAWKKKRLTARKVNLIIGVVMGGIGLILFAGVATGAAKTLTLNAFVVLAGLLLASNILEDIFNRKIQHSFRAQDDMWDELHRLHLKKQAVESEEGASSATE